MDLCVLNPIRKLLSTTPDLVEGFFPRNGACSLRSRLRVSIDRFKSSLKDNSQSVEVAGHDE